VFEDRTELCTHTICPFLNSCLPLYYEGVCAEENCRLTEAWGTGQLWSKGERPFRTFKRQICIPESAGGIVDFERVMPGANSTSEAL
jgi:hypothetical protein